MQGPGKNIKQRNEVQSIKYEVEVEKASEGAQHLPSTELQSSRTRKRKRTKKKKKQADLPPVIDGENQKTRAHYSMANVRIFVGCTASLGDQDSRVDESFEAGVTA